MKAILLVKESISSRGTTQIENVGYPAVAKIAKCHFTKDNPGRIAPDHLAGLGPVEKIAN